MLGTFVFELSQIVFIAVFLLLKQLPMQPLNGIDGCSVSCCSFSFAMEDNTLSVTMSQSILYMKISNKIYNLDISMWIFDEEEAECGRTERIRQSKTHKIQQIE